MDSIFRKAAGLLFEMDTTQQPEAEAKDPVDLASIDIDDPLARMEAQRVSVDELLAEQGLGKTKNPSTRAAAPSAPMTPSAPKTAADIARDTDGPNLEDVKVDANAAPTSGALSPSAIYGAAKLPPAPFTAEQMLEMLNSLPQELPLETKRQTVKVTLGAIGKTVGATPETIVADASRKMAALASYVQFLSKRAQETTNAAERDIEALQKQIEEKRATVAKAHEELSRVTRMCEGESNRLDDVLEFFSLDVPPSKYAGGAGQSPVPNAPQNPPQK